MRRNFAGRCLVAMVTAGTVAAGSPPPAPAAPSPVRLTQQTFAQPPKEVRPGTRWWWDSLITDTGFSLPDALKEVDAFAKAGFGRFEIAWASKTYGTAEERANLKAVAQRAKQDNVQLDMTLGDSWPWVAPTAQGELGHQELMYGRSDVTGPAHFSGAVSGPIGSNGPSGTLRAVTAARVITRGPAVTQVDKPPASTTVLDPNSLVDLTDRVKGTTLNWDVPAGDWIIFSFWQRPASKCGAYTSRSGPCVSLIDDKSVRAGTSYVEHNQVGDAAPAVSEVGHSFFEDSLEYTADELFWSSSFPAEFLHRRGYDLTKYLPLMFVEGVSDNPTPATEPVPDFDLPNREGDRYRHDYYQTVTDLYIDNHLKVVGRWAKRYGMQFRAQMYGSEMDLTRSAREAARAGVLVDSESLGPDAGGLLTTVAYDKPDSPQWRAAMERYRTITSGSEQGGGLEMSSELGAMFAAELHMFLRNYKRMMDKEWAGGLTRPILHGVTHSPAGTPWPGASHFGGIVGESLNYQTWPEWTHFKPLSDYWARGALVLEQGRARTDVAVLRDTFDNGPVFDGVGLEKQGYTIGYVDPQGLATAATGKHGELFPGGPAYRVLVVDPDLVFAGPGRIPGATARAINAASAKGLKVVFVGDVPSRGTSGKDPAKEDKQVRRALRSVLTRRTTARVPTQADVPRAVALLGSRPRAQWGTPSRLYAQERETRNATYYLLWNATGDTQELTGSFAASGAPAALDLWGGAVVPVARYTKSRSRVTVPLELAPHATMVLRFDKRKRRPHVTSATSDDVVSSGDGAVELRDAKGGPQTVAFSNGTNRSVSLPKVTDAPIVLGTPDVGGLWQLQVTTYGPEGNVERPAIPLAELADWRTIPGLQSESGIGTYTAHVNLPQSWTGPNRGAKLDLGTYEGSVQVSVNDKLVTPDIDPQAPLDITALLRPGDNVVKVVLATTPFNKAVASPTTIIERPAWPASVTNGTEAYGLLSDVRLLPYARANVDLPRAHGRTAGSPRL